MRKIPKIIHYCWFGNGPKPENIQKFIAGWKELLPDYEFMEWNEQNFDITQTIPYVKQAYEARKFAFVSDYVRICALYQYGGIYLDTDVEIRKRFDCYLEDKSMVLGFESERSLITAFIAAEKGHPYIKEFMDSYENRSFLLEDGSFDLMTINEGLSKLMEQKGVDLDRNELQELDGGIMVYPQEFFCGFDVRNWHEAITEQTCTVHYMNSSWVSGKQGLKRKLIQILHRILGYDNYDKLRAFLKGK